MLLLRCCLMPWMCCTAHVINTKPKNQTEALADSMLTCPLRPERRGTKRPLHIKLQNLDASRVRWSEILMADEAG
jgi:hypothetical protein